MQDAQPGVTWNGIPKDGLVGKYVDMRPGFHHEVRAHQAITVERLERELEADDMDPFGFPDEVTKVSAFWIDCVPTREDPRWNPNGRFYAPPIHHFIFVDSLWLAQETHDMQAARAFNRDYDDEPFDFSTYIAGEREHLREWIDENFTPGSKEHTMRWDQERALEQISLATHSLKPSESTNLFLDNFAAEQALKVELSLRQRDPRLKSILDRPLGLAIVQIVERCNNGEWMGQNSGSTPPFGTPATAQVIQEVLGFGGPLLEEAIGILANDGEILTAMGNEVLLPKTWRPNLDVCRLINDPKAFTTCFDPASRRAANTRIARATASAIMHDTDMDEVTRRLCTPDLDDGIGHGLGHD